MKIKLPLSDNFTDKNIEKPIISYHEPYDSRKKSVALCHPMQIKMIIAFRKPSGELFIW